MDSKINIHLRNVKNIEENLDLQIKKENDHQITNTAMSDGTILENNGNLKHAEFENSCSLGNDIQKYESRCVETNMNIPETLNASNANKYISEDCNSEFIEHLVLMDLDARNIIKMSEMNGTGFNENNDNVIVCGIDGNSNKIDVTIPFNSNNIKRDENEYSPETPCTSSFKNKISDELTQNLPSQDKIHFDTFTNNAETDKITDDYQMDFESDLMVHTILKNNEPVLNLDEFYKLFEDNDQFESSKTQEDTSKREKINEVVQDNITEPYNLALSNLNLSDVMNFGVNETIELIKESGWFESNNTQENISKEEKINEVIRDNIIEKHNLALSNMILSNVMNFGWNKTNEMIKESGRFESNKNQENISKKENICEVIQDNIIEQQDVAPSNINTMNLGVNEITDKSIKEFEELLYKLKQKLDSGERNCNEIKEHENTFMNKKFSSSVPESRQLERKVDPDDIIVITDSESECEGYHSSDFEFITESEAELGGLITNRAFEKLKINGKEGVCETRRSIDSRENSHNSNNNPISSNGGEQNHDNAKYWSKSYNSGLRVQQYKADIENNRRNCEIPQGEAYLGLFQGYASTSIILENKSTIPPTCMTLPDVGFNGREVRFEEELLEDSVRQEAEESKKRIVEKYRIENRKRKRRF